MGKRRNVVLRLFENYIRNTKEKEIVALESTYICRLTFSVHRLLGYSDSKVYINTKVLKHLYDRKPAEEFDFIIRHLHEIIKYPDFLYKNKISKKGDYCLVKQIDGVKYLCSLDYSDDGGEMKINVVTAFRVRDEAYLKNYELLWSWKGGDPSS